MTIDWWTLGLQTVNIVILVWLLQRFFWKPIAGMIAERRDAAQKALADARAARDKAQAALAEIAKTRAGFAEERDKILAEAHAEAERASAAKLAEAAEQAAALVAAAKAGVAKDEEAARRAWASRSSDLAVDIAKRLAARLGRTGSACGVSRLGAEGDPRAAGVHAVSRDRLIPRFDGDERDAARSRRAKTGDPVDRRGVRRARQTRLRYRSRV